MVVTSTTASNSTSPKGGLLACPAGTVPVGGGGAINSAAPGITIVQDNAGPTGWLFAAIEQTGGVASSWSLTTWAVCATPPAGYQVIVANGTITPKTPAVATCPGSKIVIGAGASLDTPVGDNVRVIESIRPNPALTSVTASAVLDPFAITGPASNVVHAYAICINPQPGQVLVTANSAARRSNFSFNSRSAMFA